MWPLSSCSMRRGAHLLGESLQLLFGINILPDPLHVVPVLHYPVLHRVPHRQQAPVLLIVREVARQRRETLERWKLTTEAKICLSICASTRCVSSILHKAPWTETMSHAPKWKLNHPLPVCTIFMKEWQREPLWKWKSHMTSQLAFAWRLKGDTVEEEYVIW